MIVVWSKTVQLTAGLLDDTTYLSPEKVERGIGLEHLLEGATTLSITTLRIAKFSITFC